MLMTSSDLWADSGGGQRERLDDDDGHDGDNVTDDCGNSPHEQ